MVRRAWQWAMINLARSSVATRLMQHNRAASVLASKYVAGANPARAVELASELVATHGIRSSLFYLGEYVNRLDLVAENVANKLALVQLLQHTDLDIHVSIDPTQIGQSLDPE